VEQPKDEVREPVAESADARDFEKLTTSRLAKALGLRSGELGDKLLSAGLVERDGEHLKLTAKGKAAGGEFRVSGKFGPYFLWPADLHL
jgi:hypothetical protein